jgi:arylsulfatase A-like enzyme
LCFHTDGEKIDAMPRRLGLLALLCLVGLCWACRTKPARPPADGVILFLSDALRADHLGCYGYARPTSPHIDALAADSTRFVHALSPAPWTLPAMATLWTSLYPSLHGATRISDLQKWMRSRDSFHPVSTLSESYTTLAEVLKANGFETVAFVDGSYPGKVFGFGQGFDEFVEDERYGDRLNIEGLFEWLDRNRPKKFFAYIHSVEVHSPYTPPGVPQGWAARKDEQGRYALQALAEERARYAQFDFDPAYEGDVDGSWPSLQKISTRRAPLSRRDVEHLVALYDRGIAYTDYWIGQLVEGLKERGLYDRTVLIFTADHGEELLDHGGVEHGKTYYEELMRIPLIVRVPGERQGRSPVPQVGLIDVTPTVLDLAGIPADRLHLQGRSLRPLLDGEPFEDRTMFAEASMIPRTMALRTNELKYIQKQGRSGELYDLSVDPSERNNLCANDGSRCDEFAEQVSAWHAAMQQTAREIGAPAPRAARIDAKTRERLRALGYKD